jgi:hypothetical protein
LNDRNVVLTRLPCGGTTLSCYLLGKARNTVVVNEPIRRDEFAHLLLAVRPPRTAWNATSGGRDAT